MKAFRSTLEEARNADLLLHVVDVSHEEYRHMMDVTNATLQEVGVENVPTLFVYNKSDLAGVPHPKVEGDGLWISAKTGDGLDELLAVIKKRIFADYRSCRMVIPFDRGDIVSYLNKNATVKETEYEEEGTSLKVEISRADYERFREFIVAE